MSELKSQYERAVPGQWNTPRFSELQVSDKWKERFSAIEDAGGPTLSNIRGSSKAVKKLVNRNWPAFFFGPVYLTIKGLWPQALTYIVLFFCIYMIARVSHSFYMLAFGLLFLAHFCAYRANVGYYKKRVLGQVSWV